MRLHFIAIGGAAMHNLAIALHLKGAQISGSDDEIFDPSKSRLEKYGLLPAEFGWNADQITNDLDAVILGMHARENNPELLKAQELGLKIYSFPEYLYEHSKNKTRVVIGGSHGKTTITAMILHVLKECKVEADYMVGAQLDGFEVMVKLSDTAQFMVLEGDEYLTSPIDRRPKFHVYKPNIALLSGIAWDHINVFPTFENYVEQFKIFTNLIEEGGSLVYCKSDGNALRVAKETKNDVSKIAYSLPDYVIKDGISTLQLNDKEYPLEVFGEHNLQNIMGAMNVCKQMGIGEDDFLKAIQSFAGASNRLELVNGNDHTVVYKDFAHSPSKLRATVNAVKLQYPERKLIACMELHTFSSLNVNFLSQYEGCMDAADIPVVYYNPKTIEHKKLPPLSPMDVKEAFKNERIKIFNETEELMDFLLWTDFFGKNLLMMSSGNFGGIDVNKLAAEIVG